MEGPTFAINSTDDDYDENWSKDAQEGQRICEDLLQEKAREERDEDIQE